MSDPTDFSVDAQVQRINAEYGRRQKRFLLGYLIADLIVLGAAAAIMFDFRLVDINTGKLVLAGITFVAAICMVIGLRHLLRARQRAIRDAGGAVSGPADAAR